MGHSPGSRLASRQADSQGGTDQGNGAGVLPSARACLARGAGADAQHHQAIRAVEQRAADFLSQFQEPRRHHIVCAMLLDDGREVFGLNIVSNIGVASVCAEQIALGEAMKLLPQAEVSIVVTLRATFREPVAYEIVPPCGRCREILCEYAPSARIVLGRGTAVAYDLASIDTLLPRPFRRRAQGRWPDCPATSQESGSC